jgi:hypothetical protein
MAEVKRDIEGWVKFLTDIEIPVMRQTVRSINTAYHFSLHLA